MKKKNLITSVCVSLGSAGLLYATYRRLMKINSRAYKNAQNKNVGE